MRTVVTKTFDGIALGNTAEPKCARTCAASSRGWA